MILKPGTLQALLGLLSDSRETSISFGLSVDSPCRFPLKWLCWVLWELFVLFFFFRLLCFIWFYSDQSWKLLQVMKLNIYQSCLVLVWGTYMIYITKCSGSLCHISPAKVVLPCLCRVMYTLLFCDFKDSDSFCSFNNGPHNQAMFRGCYV